MQYVNTVYKRSGISLMMRESRTPMVYGQVNVVGLTRRCHFEIDLPRENCQQSGVETYPFLVQKHFAAAGVGYGP